MDFQRHGLSVGGAGLAHTWTRGVRFGDLRLNAFLRRDGIASFLCARQRWGANGGEAEALGAEEAAALRRLWGSGWTGVCSAGAWVNYAIPVVFQNKRSYEGKTERKERIHSLFLTAISVAMVLGNVRCHGNWEEFFFFSFIQTMHFSSTKTDPSYPKTHPPLSKKKTKKTMTKQTKTPCWYDTKHLHT